MINVNNNKYELIENINNCFVEEEFKELCTDYFDDFDYILGDYAYSKLRLKGFYNDTNKKVKDLNKYGNKAKYLEDNCAFNCKYFILKKI